MALQGSGFKNLASGVFVLGVFSISGTGVRFSRMRLLAGFGAGEAPTEVPHRGAAGFGAGEACSETALKGAGGFGAGEASWELACEGAAFALATIATSSFLRFAAIRAACATCN